MLLEEQCIGGEVDKGLLLRQRAEQRRNSIAGHNVSPFNPLGCEWRAVVAKGQTDCEELFESLLMKGPCRVENRHNR